jgi:serine/threonine protein kinase/tetratricopeptide (TPR) repeat protein
MKCPKCHSENPDTQKFCGECATPLTAPDAQPSITKTIETPREELTTGSTFAGRYQIIEELGKGGMGKVYRVLDKKLNEEVALKLIKPEIASDKQTLERFKNELKLARKVSQKNVGRMFDMGEETGIHYITMEYVSGEDLKSFIRRVGQLPVGKALAIAKQLCEGLSEAHGIGIVHRDLKPSNIMIDKEGNARIMDFGIARSAEGKKITGAGVMIGTPEYMSPEQVEGKEVDQRSDIYSLGIILYEMLTGRLPFEADTPFAVGVKHKSEIPKSPKEFNPQIPDTLSSVILKCLEKDKSERYQNAGEIKSELERLEQDLPTIGRVVPTKKPLTSREITVKFNMKKMLLPALAVLAALVIVLFLWSPWTDREQSSIFADKPSIAILPFENISQDKDLESLCEGIPDNLITRLTMLKDKLRVQGRTSSFSFKGKDADIREIGSKLDVKTVLEGSLQKLESRLLIGVRLVNVADSQSIWAREYEKDEVNILDLRDEIVFDVLENLKIELIEEEVSKLNKRDTINPEAFGLYMKGRFFWNKRTEEGLTKALDYFQEAIVVDENYALAYSGMADCYSILPWSGWLPKDLYPKARIAAQKALQIDGQLSEAHASLAFIKFYFDRDWTGSEKEYKRAVELNPGYSSAHQWYGGALCRLGRLEEGIAELERAAELDPLSLIINCNLGAFLFRARRYDEALEQLKKTLEIDPNFEECFTELGNVYFKKGMYERAIQEYIRLRNPLGDSNLIAAYMALGKMEKSFQILAEWAKRNSEESVSPVTLANVYLGVGDLDRVFQLLEKAYTELYPQLMDVFTNPIFVDALYDDPRFKELQNKMNPDIKYLPVRSPLPE